VFYYPGAKFDTSLLIQSFIMIAIQTVLLRVALDHRPSPSSSVPFAAGRDGDIGMKRPYNFWQWRSPKPYVSQYFQINSASDTAIYRYWQFLLYLFITLVAFELVLSPLPGLYKSYSSLIGYVGLGIEATLPIPQILSNARSRSCKGFRVSVLASWIAGDVMKMFWFFTATTEIPWSFKLCGIFQMCCDFFLGGQYFVYGNGPAAGAAVIKEHMSPAVEMRGNGHGLGFGNALDLGRRTPGLEKEGRLG
jgi:hypothetical protein